MEKLITNISLLSTPTSTVKTMAIIAIISLALTPPSRINEWSIDKLSLINSDKACNPINWNQ